MAYQRDTTHPPSRDATPEREVRPVPTGSEIVQLIGRLQDLRGFRDQHWEGSFEDYLQIVRHNPKVTRTAFQRMYDNVLSRGTREYYEYKKKILHYNFFDDKEHAGIDAIFGLAIPLMKLVNVFKSAAQRYGTEKRVLLLHGPVGSSKSTIVRLLKKGLEAYSQADGGGYLRHLVVREGRNTGQALVQLVTAPGERFETGYLVDVLRRFPEVRSVHWSVNDSPAEVTNLPSELLWGDGWIEEELCGLRFRVRPNAFLQTNTAMAEKLYGLAREAARLGGTETVWDLYCGIGTIGLSLAADALTVWGIEVSEESVACALENAELNGITNSAFFAGNVGQVVEELLERSGPPDVIVVDPPRAGLAGKALRRLGRIGAPRLVYVSCNPTTLAGDVKLLQREWGYELRRARPVDMFPHTPHVETVALLEKPVE